jgi:hypothetical protein
MPVSLKQKKVYICVVFRGKDTTWCRHIEDILHHSTRLTWKTLSHSLSIFTSREQYLCLLDTLLSQSQSHSNKGWREIQLNPVITTSVYVTPCLQRRMFCGTNLFLTVKHNIIRLRLRHKIFQSVSSCYNRVPLYIDPANHYQCSGHAACSRLMSLIRFKINLIVNADNARLISS